MIPCSCSLTTRGGLHPSERLVSSVRAASTDLAMVSSTLALGIGLDTKFFKLDEATSTLIASGAAHMFWARFDLARARYVRYFT
jgi:hypothetical protein